jgi:hypothetical protein
MIFIPGRKHVWACTACYGDNFIFTSHHNVNQTDAVKPVESESTFRRMSPPTSGSHNRQSKVAAWGWLEGSFTNLKMEATCSSETSVHFQRITQRNIAQDKTCSRGNLDPYKQNAFGANNTTRLSNGMLQRRAYRQA